MADASDRDRHRRDPPPPERGFVLPVVLLLLLALTLLVHGGLALVQVQELAGRAGGLALRARLLAEGAVREAGAGVLPDRPAPWTSEALLESDPEEDAEVEVELHRSGREWVLLEGRARVGRGALVAGRGVGRMYWVLDPASRLGAADAVLASPAPPGGAGLVDGTTVAAAPENWPPPVCEPHRAIVDSLFPDGRLATWAPSPRAPDGPGATPSLGLLDGPALLDRATLRIEGTVRPRSALRSGACDGRGSLNWGAPSDPLGPCGGRHVVVASAGAVVVDGGEGQGVLAVEGDLTLADHRFAGVVLVGGALRLLDGAEIVGLVRTGGPVEVEGGSRLLASGCAVLRGLEGALVRRRLGRPFPLPSGPWIPLP